MSGCHTFHVPSFVLAFSKFPLFFLSFSRFLPFCLSCFLSFSFSPKVVLPAHFLTTDALAVNQWLRLHPSLFRRLLSYSHNDNDDNSDDDDDDDDDGGYDEDVDEDGQGYGGTRTMHGHGTGSGKRRCAWWCGRRRRRSKGCCRSKRSVWGTVFVVWMALQMVRS